jgi:O-antigen/teichoic acid export membrane protein
MSAPVHSTAPDLKGAAALLTTANVACTAIGASQGLLILWLLGPGYFGAVAVLVALTGVAANLIDVRLTDLVSKLYYDDRASDAASGAEYRTSVLRLGLGLSLLGAGLIAVVSFALLSIGARRLTGVELTAAWLWMAAGAQGVSYLGSFVIFIQRFIAPPRRMAILQLASAVINAAVMLLCVAIDRTVGGYVLGLVASAAGIAALNAWQTVTILRQDGVVWHGRRRVAAPVIDRRVVVEFLVAGNAQGYVKLLHRAADVLLVAAFCSDAATGVYKLARSIADTLLVASEAIGRVYQPRLLSLLQARDHVEFAAVTRSITMTAAALTVAALAAEAAFLPILAPVLGVAGGQDLTVSVAILTLSFFFVAGLQSWIWPAFVYFGRPGRCTFWGAVAVTAGQYTIGPALVFLTGHATPAWFSLGYLSYYVLAVPPLWCELRSEQPSLVWRPGALATS